MHKDLPIHSSSHTEPAEPTPEYLNLPNEMRTYHIPSLPEPEQVANMLGTQSLMQALQAALNVYVQHQAGSVIKTDHLDAANLQLAHQILGDGEVSIRCEGQRHVNIQESALAGIWHIVETVQSNTAQAADASASNSLTSIQVGAIPAILEEVLVTEGQSQFILPAAIPSNLMNAPAVLAEIRDKQNAYQSGQAAHVVNLTLLPMTAEDQTFMKQQLGQGTITILSKGYGNCRITSTQIQHVWWVQYFNSMDSLILNTLEVVDIPQVALAALEDLQDSQKRLTDILQDYLQWAI